jgi:hypothetical protein
MVERHSPLHSLACSDRKAEVVVLTRRLPKELSRIRLRPQSRQSRQVYRILRMIMECFIVTFFRLCSG